MRHLIMRQKLMDQVTVNGLALRAGIADAGSVSHKGTSTAAWASPARVRGRAPAAGDNPSRRE